LPEVKHRKTFYFPSHFCLFIYLLLLLFCYFPLALEYFGFPLAPLVFESPTAIFLFSNINRQMSIISNGSDTVKKNWPLKGEASRPSASKEKDYFTFLSHLIIIRRERERERVREREWGFFYPDLFHFNQRRISHKWRQEQLFNNNKPEVLSFWILVFFFECLFLVFIIKIRFNECCCLIFLGCWFKFCFKLDLGDSGLVSFVINENMKNSVLDSYLFE